MPRAPFATSLVFALLSLCFGGSSAAVPVSVSWDMPAPESGVTTIIFSAFVLAPSLYTCWNEETQSADQCIIYQRFDYSTTVPVTQTSASIDVPLPSGAVVFYGYNSCAPPTGISVRACRLDCCTGGRL